VNGFVSRAGFVPADGARFVPAASHNVNNIFTGYFRPQAFVYRDCKAFSNPAKSTANP
jgi:hypothetical protein